MLFAYLAFGWCVDDDLFFVPDHGRQLLHADHHDGALEWAVVVALFVVCVVASFVARTEWRRSPRAVAVGI